MRGWAGRGGASATGLSAPAEKKQGEGECYEYYSYRLFTVQLFTRNNVFEKKEENKHVVVCFFHRRQAEIARSISAAGI